jgi:hypothetical protein
VRTLVDGVDDDDFGGGECKKQGRRWMGQYNGGKRLESVNSNQADRF